MTFECLLENQQLCEGENAILSASHAITRNQQRNEKQKPFDTRRNNGTSFYFGGGDMRDFLRSVIFSICYSNTNQRNMLRV